MYSFICISMNSQTLIDYLMSCDPLLSLFILTIKLSLSWTVGALFVLLTCPFHFFKYFLTFWSKMFRLILYLTHPRICHFSKETWIFLRKKGILKPHFGYQILSLRDAGLSLFQNPLNLQS
jgi:hypothetical protein